MTLSEHLIYVGVGSNIAPEENIEKAITLLAAYAQVVDVSGFYWNAALDRDGLPSGQARFLNGACAVATQRDSDAFKEHVLRSIEHTLLRVRTEDQFAARTIDLDVLVEAGQNGKWRVLDDGIWKHAFIFRPLYELLKDKPLDGELSGFKKMGMQLDATGLERHAVLTSRLQERIRQ
ncbi:MAG: 2-amino-4-hydroxy-6-hydroxymethyldihydropteridine diphosphokinase [Deltaproteobacteria bacterium]|nr:2-amino-4-hydroxy-6-hydroxymethyldihydropteridine diphosphokinase [Deltaproteobacteria bacterium]MBN2671504.1 2-amino-4-hydroxy-6-hydroxymethyldihydropteridine diphosphokinase [Deltaproteobacteria bacterium]